MTQELFSSHPMRGFESSCVGEREGEIKQKRETSMGYLGWDSCLRASKKPQNISVGLQNKI